MIALWEEAPHLNFLGMEIYTFGLYAALGSLVALIVLALQFHREKLKKGTLALTGVLALGLGFLFSRLLFILLDRSLGDIMPLQGMILITGGGYSMIGALMGAMAGAMLAGKATGQRPMRLADLMAPALMLFVACERLGEGYLTEFGVSRPLLGDFLKGSFLAVEGDYDWYLATYLLESFTALILALILLRDAEKQSRAGQTILLAMLLYGGAQTILESLRYDRHLSFSFVGSQHIMAITLMGAALIILAIRQWQKRKKIALAAVIALPLVVGMGIGLEFMIDRTTINRYLLYAVYILLIAAPVSLGLQLRKEA